MYSRSTGEVNSNRVTWSLLRNEPDFRPMNTKFERLLSKSLTTLEVMSYYLVVHTGPGVVRSGRFCACLPPCPCAVCLWAFPSSSSTAGYFWFAVKVSVTDLSGVGFPVTSFSLEETWYKCVWFLYPLTTPARVALPGAYALAGTALGSLRHSRDTTTLCTSCALCSLVLRCSPPRWPSGKASASRAEDPGFESRLRRDFFGVEPYQ